MMVFISKKLNPHYVILNFICANKMHTHIILKLTHLFCIRVFETGPFYRFVNFMDHKCVTALLCEFVNLNKKLFPMRTRTAMVLFLCVYFFIRLYSATNDIHSTCRSLTFLFWISLAQKSTRLLHSD